ncbi:hypothetical protein [Streptomyces youssoufiensis]
MLTPPAEQAVAALIADLQRVRAGLPHHGSRPPHEQARHLSDEVAAGGLAPLVHDLLDASDPAPVTTARLDLTQSDSRARLASYELWRGEARERITELWEWVTRRRQAAGAAPWWSVGMGLPPVAESLRRLADVSEPITCLAPLARRWAATAGLAGGTAEHDWRWLMLGNGLPQARAEARDLPTLDHLLRRLVQRLRVHDLLPTSHTVRLLRRPNSPSMVLPVQVPGDSLLSLPTEVSPATVQYLQHELAHLAEHALRPPDAQLAERWRFDPVRSEGWALLMEYVVRSPDSLRQLGLTPRAAVDLSRFLHQEEAFSRGMMAVDVALDARLGTLRTPRELLAEAARLLARTGLGWAPELVALRLTRIVHWRAYLAGYAFRDAALGLLTRRFGAGWSADARAWLALRTALAATGSASDFLATLGGRGSPEDRAHSSYTSP